VTTYAAINKRAIPTKAQQHGWMEMRPYWYQSGRRHIYRIVPPILIDDLAEQKKPQAYYCARTFCEHYEMVHARYFYCAQAGLAMCDPIYEGGLDGAPQPGADQPGLDSLQHDFVNHTENFYQSFYSLISWLFRLLSVTAPHGSFRGVALGSVRGGLDDIQRMQLSRCICDSLAEIRRVLRVRNDFIVHPNVKRPWSWITAGSAGCYRIVYFFFRDPFAAEYVTRRPLTRIWPQLPLDVDEPHFAPPVQHDGFVVAPHPARAIAAVDELVAVMMETVASFVHDRRSGTLRRLSVGSSQRRD
jgi:hypothetical protein